MGELLPIIFITVFASIFGAALVFLSSKLGPKVKQSHMKTIAYECGLEGQSTGHSNVPVKFYLTAILFILFDIEIIFMYPWAMSFADTIDAGYGFYIFGAMAVFLAIFIFGLFWEVKSKALEWD